MQTDFKKPIEATTNHDEPAQTASSNENRRLGSSQLERPSTPTELPLRATETNRRSRLLGYNMNQSSHVRTMSYNQTSRSNGPQPLDDHRGRDFENIALAEIQPTVQTWDIEPPRRTFRNSFHRISNRLSLTPSDFSIAYPTPIFPQRKGKDEPHKAEMILGLRPSKPPPVPLKVPQINASDRSSTPSLPRQAASPSAGSASQRPHCLAPRPRRRPGRGQLLGHRQCFRPVPSLLHLRLPPQNISLDYRLDW
jgi:hypothetical protein